MWAEVSSLSALSPNQHHYISIKLDSYFMIDLVSILFVEFLGLSPCMKKKHQHVELNLEDVGETRLKTYRIYYLRLQIINQ